MSAGATPALVAPCGRSVRTPGWRLRVAEEEGFEPPVPYSTAVFKTAALNHSATPPGQISVAAGFPKRLPS